MRAQAVEPLAFHDRRKAMNVDAIDRSHCRTRSA